MTEHGIFRTQIGRRYAASGRVGLREAKNFMAKKKNAKTKKTTGPQPMVLEYKVMFGNTVNIDQSLKLLMDGVNTMIGKGWQPLGGISTIHFPSGGPEPIARFYFFSQALVRYKGT